MMCKITSKIKFCNCKATSSDNLQNYWCLHRFNKDKNEMIVGEIVFPFDLITNDYEKNKSVLLKRLAEIDAFDVPLIFKNKDVLEIVFNNKDYYKRIVYGFLLKNKTWKIHEIDKFYLIGHYDVKYFGKIKKN